MISIILAVLSGLFGVGLMILDAVPALDFTIPLEFFANIQGFFNGVAFFLPVGALFSLFQIKMAVVSFRIFWSLCLRVKSFIPTISST